MQILLVEDDIRLAEAIQQILEDAGWNVDTTYNGLSGSSYAESGCYDAIIFDLMLPKIDGIEAISTLRSRGIDTPILILTAKGTVSDKIEGLDTGADAYMTKPFSPGELLARLRSLTRRTVTGKPQTITVGDLILNPNDHSLECKGESIQLSKKEVGLAMLFMENPNQVITKDTMIGKVWDSDPDTPDNNIEAYISMLRKKLRFLNSSAKIELVRKLGYKMIFTPDSLKDQGEEVC